MKLIVCDSCEAEYQIKHNLDSRYYEMRFCTFCGARLLEELEDEYWSPHEDDEFDDAD